mmetsp:Transcript_17035/g.37238  ORF Transcript_17035/g.37238 Transcript_17035/m.37238 type:complete len:226 (+) Transcript_17035:651-1328(+)
MRDHPRRRYHTDRTGDVPLDAWRFEFVLLLLLLSPSSLLSAVPEFVFVFVSLPNASVSDAWRSLSTSLPSPSFVPFFFSVSKTCSRTSILHSGQLASRSVSHGIKQSSWNLWPQGRTRTFSLCSNSSRQMQQQQESPLLSPPPSSPDSLVENSSSSSVLTCSAVSLWTRIIRARPSVWRIPGPPAKRTIRPFSSGAAVMHPHWAQTRRQPKKIKKARNPDMAAKK